MKLQTSTTESSGVQRSEVAAEEKRSSESRSWIRLSLGVIVGLVGVTFAATGFARNVDPSPTITVMVYNYAQASSATIAAAEREAGRILGEAGLRADWLDCLEQQSTAGPQGLCAQQREPIDVVLRVLSGPIQRGDQDTRFGVAFLPTLATVYYEYAVGLARSNDAGPIILGCAIAHEVGHLLLSPNGHSAAGIMRGEWGPKQLRLALMGGLLFTSQQSKLIRAEARRRASLQTGALKEERLATVNQRAESEVIP